MEIKKRFPGGRKKAVTLSYDDGVTQDIRLIDMMNQNGIIGTFNLNSGKFGIYEEFPRAGKTVHHQKINKDDIAKVYQGHEIAVHTVSHPNLCKLTEEQITAEVLLDRIALEEITGYPVRGMAYPYGTFRQEVIRILKSLGISYAREVAVTNDFSLPENRYAWKCSTYHTNENFEQIVDRFLEQESDDPMLLSIWGHSYEFDCDENWDMMERVLKKLGGNTNFWYVSNIDIFNYLDAFDLLKFDVKQTTAQNFSAFPLFFNKNGKEYQVAPGKTIWL